MGYEPSWLYKGGFLFKQHNFEPKLGELRETTPNGNLVTCWVVTAPSAFCASACVAKLHGNGWAVEVSNAA